MTQWKPKRENWKDEVLSVFDRMPIHHHFGMKLTTIEPGFVVATMARQKNLTQQHGAFHAGALITLADAVAGCASWSLIADGDDLLSSNITTSLLRIAQTDRVRAEGRIIKPGSRLYFCESIIYDDIANDSKPLLQCMVTIAVI